MSKLDKLNEKYMYRHRMNIHREVEVKQKDCSIKKNLELIGSNIPCLMSQKQQDKPEIESIAEISEVLKLFCNSSVDIKAGDFIEIESKFYLAGEPFLYPEHIELLLSLNKTS